jgi:hypothetical protein
MVQALDKRGATPRTLLKIILMLGCVLAGVAALAAEPEPAPTDTGAADASCAQTAFEFGGRVTQNGEATDTWTLTCWRRPATGEAASAPTVDASLPPATSRPLPATPVATLPVCLPGCVPAPARF